MIKCALNATKKLILPSIFPEKIIKSSSPSDLSQKFDSWLRQFFLEKFGKVEKGRYLSPRINKQLENLRRRKKECKKAHQALLKAGLSGIDVEKRISVEWHQLIREHNKQRVALQKKKSES